MSQTMLMSYAMVRYKANQVFQIKGSSVLHYHDFNFIKHSALT